ncbi:oligosaccharide flippase family protein [Vibrio amylolyticus]|uniref:oligosaccharide flippase family protein n=1 Tax=Vibrio amylolyticus TaxID=2847292 RepID=UPI00354C8DC2
MKNLNSKLNSAILKSVSGKYFVYIVQLVSLIILSRLFTPEMFGVIASVQVVLLFFQLVANSGIAPVIIYQTDISQSQRDGIFSASALFSIFVSVIVFSTCFAFFDYINISRDDIFRSMLSIAVFFSCSAMLPAALLQKETRFSLLARSEVLAEILSFALCITLLNFGFSVYSLFAKFASVPVFRFSFYMYYSVRTQVGMPRFGRKLSEILPLLDFIKYQMLFNVVNFFSRNLDTILITKYFGTATVGFYDKSYQLMRYPLQLFTFAINPALQPILTQHKEQVDIVTKAYYQVTYKLAFCGVFVSFVLYHCSADILTVLFGRQWVEGHEILSILAISIPLQMVLSSTGGVFQAYGEAKEQFKCGLFSSVTNVSAILIGVVQQDVNLLCFALTVSMLVNYLQCFYVLNKKIFKGSCSRKLYLLTFLIILPYINLLIPTSFADIEITYLDSIFNISGVATIVLSVQAFAYFMYSKLKQRFI